MVKIRRTNQQNKTTKNKTPSWDQNIEFLTTLFKLFVSTYSTNNYGVSLDVDLL